MQLGRFTNEASEVLSHPPNSAESHNTLRSFAEVSMVSISWLHPNIGLNSIYCHLFLCRGSAKVLDGWCFTATALEVLMCPSPSHHRFLQQALHREVTALAKDLYR
jgi:hypothetical protein